MFPAIIGFISTIIDRIIPDKHAADLAKLEMMKLQESNDFAIMIEQIKVNAAEGASQNVFVAGWRPLIGWICGAAFAWQTLIVPIIAFLAAAAGHPIALPVFPMEVLLSVMMGMLGLGGLRTYEKLKGISADITSKKR